MILSSSKMPITTPNQSPKRTPQAAAPAAHPLKHPHQRVGVFIDIQNLYYSAKNLYGAKCHFGNVVKEGVAGRQLIRAIAYVVRTESGEEQPFFEALYNQGLETRERDLQTYFSGNKKADWDVGITVDAIRIAELLDVVILVSGDGDYLPLVEYLQNRGRQVEVMSFRETTSTRLVEAADCYTDLSGDQNTFLIRDNNRAERAPRRTGAGAPPRTRTTQEPPMTDKP